MKPAPKGETIRFANIHMAAYLAEDCVFELCILTLDAADPPPRLLGCAMGANIMQGTGWAKYFPNSPIKVIGPKDTDTF